VGEGGAPPNKNLPLPLAALECSAWTIFMPTGD